MKIAVLYNTGRLWVCYSSKPDLDAETFSRLPDVSAVWVLIGDDCSFASVKPQMTKIHFDN